MLTIMIPITVKTKTSTRDSNKFSFGGVVGGWKESWGNISGCSVAGRTGLLFSYERFTRNGANSTSAVVPKCGFQMTLGLTIRATPYPLQLLLDMATSFWSTYQTRIRFQSFRTTRIPIGFGTWIGRRRKNKIFIQPLHINICIYKYGYAYTLISILKYMCVKQQAMGEKVVK